MKVKRRMIIIILSLLLIICCGARIIYVNSRFPKGKYTLYREGEAAEYNEIKYMGISGEIMTLKEYMDKYQCTDLYDDGESYEVVLWIQMENKSDEENSFTASDMVLTKGVWANGVDIFALRNINGDDFDTNIEAGEKKLIGISTQINSQTKELIEGDEPWTVRITEWPDRIEFEVPVEKRGET